MRPVAGRPCWTVLLSLLFTMGCSESGGSRLVGPEEETTPVVYYQTSTLAYSNSLLRGRMTCTKAGLRVTCSGIAEWNGTPRTTVTDYDDRGNPLEVTITESGGVQRTITSWAPLTAGRYFEASTSQLRDGVLEWQRTCTRTALTVACTLSDSVKALSMTVTTYDSSGNVLVIESATSGYTSRQVYAWEPLAGRRFFARRRQIFSNESLWWDEHCARLERLVSCERRLLDTTGAILESRSSTSTYDERGNLLLYSAGTGPTTERTAYVYDANDNVTERLTITPSGTVQTLATWARLN